MSSNAVKGILSTLTLACAMAFTAGCHTIEGAGRDVEAVGQGVAGGAEETRPYNGQRQDRYDNQRY